MLLGGCHLHLRPSVVSISTLEDGTVDQSWSVSRVWTCSNMLLWATGSQTALGAFLSTEHFNRSKCLTLLRCERLIWLMRNVSWVTSCMRYGLTSGADIIFQNTKVGEEVVVVYLHLLLPSWYSVKCHMLVSSEIFFSEKVTKLLWCIQ